MTNSTSSTTLFKFSAPWCAPCRAMKPVVEKVLAEFADINYVDVNIDEDPEMAVKHGVRAIPTLILVNEQGARRLVGSATAEQVKEFLSQT